jgi:hypothetical protein
LFVIYLMDGDVKDGEKAACLQALQEQGCDISSVKFLEGLKDMLTMAHQPTVTAQHESVLRSACLQAFVHCRGIGVVVCSPLLARH